MGGNMNNQKYCYRTFTVSFSGAVTNQELQIAGTHLMYLSGDVQLSVRLDSHSNDLIPLEMMQALNYPFSRLFFTTNGPGAVTLAVSSDLPNFLGQTKAYITKDDSWFYDAMQARSFIGGTIQSGVVGEYSHIELWNPSGSKVKGIVLAGNVSMSAAASIKFASHNAQIGTIGQKGNKYLGGAGSMLSVYRHSNVAELGTDLSRFSCYVNSVLTDLIISPFIIPPGVGLIVRLESVNVSISAQFEWIEVPE